MRLNAFFKENSNYLILFLVSAAIRFPFLGLIPPGQENALWLRLPSATAGVLSVLVFALFVEYKTKNKLLALLSGLFLSLSPWHIEQSRVQSEVMVSLFIVSLAAVMWINKSCNRCRGVLILVTLVLLWRLYPSFWIFHPPFDLPKYSDILGNIFKLFSVKFLFFANDTFWWGGLRTVGVFLPSFLALLLVGLARQIQTFNRSYLLPIILVMLITGISAISPKFPESREYFFALPFIAFTMAVGATWIIERIWKKREIIVFLAFSIWLFFSLYEYIIFFHTYVKHYPRRIQSEIPYEKQTF